MIACSAVVFFFKQKTAYEWRISDWSSDVLAVDQVAGAAHQRYLARRRGGLGARGTLGSLHVHGFLSSRTTIAGHPRLLAGIGKRPLSEACAGQPPGLEAAESCRLRSCQRLPGLFVVYL